MRLLNATDSSSDPVSAQAASSQSQGASNPLPAQFTARSHRLTSIQSRVSRWDKVICPLTSSETWKTSGRTEAQQQVVILPPGCSLPCNRHDEVNYWMLCGKITDTEDYRISNRREQHKWILGICPVFSDSFSSHHIPPHSQILKSCVRDFFHKDPWVVPGETKKMLKSARSFNVKGCRTKFLYLAPDLDQKALLWPEPESNVFVKSKTNQTTNKWTGVKTASSAEVKKRATCWDKLWESSLLTQ